MVDAETALTNVNGDTSTAWGLRQFATMVIDDDGRIVTVGGERVFDADEEELSQ